MSRRYTPSLLFLILAISPGTAPAGVRLSGFVTSSETGEALTGANVYVENSVLGVATDRNGYYVLNNVPAETVMLVVSYLGYERLVRRLDLSPDKNLVLNLDLQPQVIPLGEVTVEAEQIRSRQRIQPGRVDLRIQQIRRQPALAEPDLFRTIQSLPGVLTTSEFSTGLVIRGGNTDQNLILLDGVTVYNPSHLGGVFSNFIVDGVKEAHLLKGGFNVEYGGRLSAVLNVFSREGNRNRFKARSSLSLLSAQTVLEGPGYKGAWLVAARRTYFDQVLKNTEYYFPYYFYDLQGHIFADITARDRISVSFYSGQDELAFEQLGLNTGWGNRTLSLAYRKLYHEQLIANYLVAHSEFGARFNLGGASGLSGDNFVSDITVSADYTYFHNDKLTWKFGWLRKGLHFSYRSTFGDSTTFNPSQSPVEAALYLKPKWQPLLRAIIEPGIRLNYYSDHPQRWYPEIRLGFKWLLTDTRFLNLTVGQYHQFIETVQDDFYPSVIDSWFAVDPSVEPAGSRQATLGYEEYFQAVYKLEVDVYHKTLHNLLTFVDTRAAMDQAMSDERLADSFVPSEGYAYGLEFFLHKMSGRLDGWLAYTWSVARKQLGGREYYTSWDRRQVFNLVGNLGLTRTWNLHWKWTYQSGQAYTPILGYYIQNIPGDPWQTLRTIPGGRNSARYPPYHRLDLSLGKHIRFKKVRLEVFVQVINAYNRDNIFRYVYLLGNRYNGLDDDGDWDPDRDDVGIDGQAGTWDAGEGDGRPSFGEPNVDELDEGMVRRRDISIFPLLPSIGVTFEF